MAEYRFLVRGWHNFVVYAVGVPLIAKSRHGLPIPNTPSGTPVHDDTPHFFPSTWHRQTSC